MKLQLAGTDSCLGLEKNGTADTHITAQKCVDVDDESQHPQFWNMDPDFGTLFPVFEIAWPRVEWNDPWAVQFVNGEVVTNAGRGCDGCADGEKFSFIVRGSE